MIDVDNLNTTYQYIITFFVLNTMLQHIGMLWIIEKHEQLKYDTEKYNLEWMTGGPWYNTYNCKKLRGIVFEGFIRKSITGRYNITCSIDSHGKKHPSSCDDDSSGEGSLLPSNLTTEELDLLGATIYFIGCCLKDLEHNVL